MTHHSTSAPLERWLTGPRFAALPTRDASHAAPALSFEFFPPRTEALEQQLWTCIRRLEPLAPRFVSVTYGAGGSTQARTHATVARILRETTLMPAAHLTCVGASRDEIDAVARALLGGRRAPHRRPARRRAGRRALRAASRRLRLCRRPGGRAEADRRFRDLGGRLPRGPPDRARAPRPTSTTSSASSTPAPPARSPSISSRPRPICASSTAASPPASPRRSCRASCRCRTSPRRRSSPPCAALACRPGSATCSRGWRRTPRPAAWWRPWWRPSRCGVLQANGIDEFHFYTLNRSDLVYAIAHILGVRPVV